MADLRKFLNAHRATTNYTHLSVSPNGKYRIDESELPTLYSLVAIETKPQHILESHNERNHGPLLIDLDFEFPDEVRFHTRQYTHEEIKRFVEAIHTAVVRFFGKQEGVEFVVSEKPSPTIETGKRVKDGIHVIGKGLIMTYPDQEKLRLYALEKHVLQSAFCTDYVVNNMNSVYDKSVIQTNSWYLLGCSKPDREPYLPTLSFIVDDGELLQRSVERSFYSIADLSIRCEGDPLTVIPSLAAEWKGITEIKTKSGSGKGKKGGKTKQEVTVISSEENVISYLPADSVSDIGFGGGGRGVGGDGGLSDITGGRPAFIQSFDTLAALVRLWSVSRAKDYAGWRNCVFCIAVCGKACGAVEKARALAHEFVLKARGADNYDTKKVDGVFNSEKRDALGFIVAHQWARIDNFTGYLNCGFNVWWKTPWAHFTVAREFYGFFADSFLLVGGIWYVYNGVYWSVDSDSAKGDSKTIKKWMSTKLFDLLYDQIKTQRDVMDGAEYQKKLAQLNLLYNKSFKNDVLSELGQFYSMPGVKFNQRPELLAFNNRIFDLNAVECIEPTADMYISMTVGYDYESVAEVDVEAMEAWVSELFDSREKTEYVLKLMASCLYRHNREEKAHFLLGRGRNGKGTLKEMMAAALGGYSGKMDLSYFTQPDKQCGAANPHLYNLKDSRVIWCDEAETDGRIVGKFSTGKIKSLTGRDKIKARPLYSGDEAEFEAGHFVALVNEMPGFTSFDFALLTRLVCIRFPYVFMPAGDYRADDPTHRRQDSRIKERVLEKRMAFMALLLKWYGRYNVDGLVLPDGLKMETLAVTDELDSVGAWARGAMEFKVGERTPIQVVFRKYVEDMADAEKDHVGIEDFGKRLRRIYEIKNCRHNDENGCVNRIISYKLKN
jgi:phage/plasmid-associated DNA primase